MGILLLAFSGVLSVLAIWFWRQLFKPRSDRKPRPHDLADTDLPDWPGLIGFLLPRPIRRVWNYLWLWIGVLLLGGLPHGLTLHTLLRRGPDENSAINYVVSLDWWLLLLALPMAALANHRVARRPLEPSE